MSKPKKGARVVDLARTKAALAKLDELAARFPHLTSKENRERLARHVDDEHQGDDEREKETQSDGTEEDDGGR